MKSIVIPDQVPTRGHDDLVARGASIEEFSEQARVMEEKYERLKLHDDNLLQQGFAPLLPVTAEITDEELELMIHQAGWRFSKTHFGTPEEWQMWTNRFRRLIAIVLTHGARR